jgi:hypothetical protein
MVMCFVAVNLVVENPPSTISLQVVVGFFALGLAILGYLQTLKLFRIKNAVECQRRILSDESIAICIAKIQAANEDIRKGKLPAWHEMAQHDEQHSMAHQAMVDWLNTLEELALGVRRNIFDERLLRDMLLTSITRTWSMAYPFIQSRQKERPRAFENFVWLGVRWMAVRDEVDPRKAKLMSKAAAALKKVLDN